MQQIYASSLQCPGKVRGARLRVCRGQYWRDRVSICGGRMPRTTETLTNGPAPFVALGCQRTAALCRTMLWGTRPDGSGVRKPGGHTRESAGPKNCPEMGIGVVWNRAEDGGGLFHMRKHDAGKECVGGPTGSP